MNCPKCNYDMFRIYSKVIEKGKNLKNCRITNIRSNCTWDYNGTDWVVECICPRCKT